MKQALKKSQVGLIREHEGGTISRHISPYQHVASGASAGRAFVKHGSCDHTKRWHYRPIRCAEERLLDPESEQICAGFISNSTSFQNSRTLFALRSRNWHTWATITSSLETSSDRSSGWALETAKLTLATRRLVFASSKMFQSSAICWFACVLARQQHALRYTGTRQSQ